MDPDHQGLFTSNCSDTDYGKIYHGASIHARNCCIGMTDNGSVLSQALREPCQADQTCLVLSVAVLEELGVTLSGLSDVKISLNDQGDEHERLLGLTEYLNERDGDDSKVPHLRLYVLYLLSGNGSFILNLNKAAMILIETLLGLALRHFLAAVKSLRRLCAGGAPHSTVFIRSGGRGRLGRQFSNPGAASVPHPAVCRQPAHLEPPRNPF